MNREIKFRAWTGEQMIYTTPEFTAGKILSRYDNVMQYIGLKDKNGKEIFEGDIVKYTCYRFIGDRDVLKEQLGKIYYKENKFKIEWLNRVDHVAGNYTLSGSLCKELEIIGNIYENTNDNIQN